MKFRWSSVEHDLARSQTSGGEVEFPYGKRMILLASGPSCEFGLCYRSSFIGNVGVIYQVLAQIELWIQP